MLFNFHSYSSFTLALLFLFGMGKILFAQQAFSIEGTIKGMEEGQLFIYYGNKGMDSTGVKNGQFVFKGYINGPTNASILKSKDWRDQANVARYFIEPGEMTLELEVNKFADSRLRGSQTQEEAQQLDKL